MGVPSHELDDPEVSNGRRLAMYGLRRSLKNPDAVFAGELSFDLRLAKQLWPKAFSDGFVADDEPRNDASRSGNVQLEDEEVRADV